jgi:DNA invertase Pin-like site-specific DNA recombinase
MKVGIYCRVSTNDKGQTTDNQLLILMEYCQKMDWQIYKVFTDTQSGSSGQRPSFLEMLNEASKRKFDLVLFWALDRFTREGTRKTIHYLELLESYGVGFKSYTESYIDTSGIFRDVIISLLSTLACQERVRLSERVMAGMSRASLKGKRMGRPQLKDAVLEKIIELRNNGLSNRKIAKEVGISHGSVNSIIRSNPKKVGVCS